MGAIDLVSLTFPSTTKDKEISDYFAKRYLFDIGLNYNHGTGHGIGVFSMVHEKPIGIASSMSSDGGTLLEEGMFLSIEPGFYLKDQFGIRLENIVLVRKAKTPYNFNNVTYLEFEPISLVPFEPKLIKVDMLERHHRRWLNAFNIKIRHKIGNELRRQRRERAYEWLLSKTNYLSNVECSKALTINFSKTLFPVIFYFLCTSYDF